MGRGTDAKRPDGRTTVPAGTDPTGNDSKAETQVGFRLVGRLAFALRGTVVAVVDPPPLPDRLSRPPVVAAVGTAAWAVLALTLLVAFLVGGRPLDLWFTTSVAGVVLGGLGYGMFAWQRAAARRGSRSAQVGTD